MNEYEWKCEGLECYPEKNGLVNVVFKADWKVIGISETLNEESKNITASLSGFQVLEEITDAENFKEFDQLTNEEVIGWVKSAMGESKIGRIKANIDKQLNILTEVKVKTIKLKLVVKTIVDDEIEQDV